MCVYEYINTYLLHLLLTTLPQAQPKMAARATLKAKKMAARPGCAGDVGKKWFSGALVVSLFFVNKVIWWFQLRIILGWFNQQAVQNANAIFLDVEFRKWMGHISLVQSWTVLIFVNPWVYCSVFCSRLKWLSCFKDTSGNLVYSCAYTAIKTASGDNTI